MKYPRSFFIAPIVFFTSFAYAQQASQELLRKQVAEGVVTIHRKEVPYVPTVAKPQAGSDRRYRRSTTLVPDSVGEFSAVLTDKAGTTKTLWKRTLGEYTGQRLHKVGDGTIHFQSKVEFFDVLVEGESPVILYGLLTDGGSLVFSDVVTDKHFESALTVAALPVPREPRLPYIASAILKGELAQNNLTAELTAKGQSAPMVFDYREGKWVYRQPAPPPKIERPARRVVVDPDAPYRGNILLQRSAQPGDTLTALRWLMRPTSSAPATGTGTANPVLPLPDTPQSYLYTFRFYSSRPPLSHRRTELWSHRLDNVTSDKQLLKMLDAAYDAKSQVLAYIYKQDKTVFANVVRADVDEGRRPLPWLNTQLPTVDASLVDRAVVENVADETLLQLTLFLSTQKTMSFRLLNSKWVLLDN